MIEGKVSKETKLLWQKDMLRAFRFYKKVIYGRYKPWSGS